MASKVLRQANPKAVRNARRATDTASGSIGVIRSVSVFSAGRLKARARKPESSTGSARVVAQALNTIASTVPVVPVWRQSCAIFKI